MIFDTDVFIWIEKGSTKAARMVERADERFLSVQSYMELLQCAENRQQHEYTREFLKELLRKKPKFSSIVFMKS